MFTHEANKHENVVSPKGPSLRTSYGEFHSVKKDGIRHRKLADGRLTVNAFMSYQLS